MSYSKKEVISIHIGQAGVQIGSAFWNLLCTEHGLNNQGILETEFNNIQYNSFFKSENKNKFTPRAIFIDTDPNSISQLKSETSRLFESEQLIAGKASSASSFARGKYRPEKNFLEHATNLIRNMAEDCLNLSGFLIFGSSNGGASGFKSLLAENLSIEYNKKPKIEISIMPSKNFSSNVLETYNTVLDVKNSMDYIDTIIPIQNESVYKISNKNKSINDFSYRNINKIVAELSSRITSSLRFESTLNTSISEIVENMVKFPRIKHVISSYSPINSDKTLSTHNALTNSLYDFNNQFVNCNTRNGKFINACSLYKGKDLNQSELINSVISLKSSEPCFGSCNFKTGTINYRQYANHQNHNNMSACSMSTNTSFNENLALLESKFKNMFESRCFVHFYVCEGMDESELYEAQENIISLRNDYKNI